jgi:hypothetical protein
MDWNGITKALGIRATANPAGSTTSARWTGNRLDTPLFLLYTLVPPRNLSQARHEKNRNREGGWSRDSPARTNGPLDLLLLSELFPSRLFCSPDTMCV